MGGNLVVLIDLSVALSQPPLSTIASCRVDLAQPKGYWTGRFLLSAPSIASCRRLSLERRLFGRDGPAPDYQSRSCTLSRNHHVPSTCGTRTSYRKARTRRSESLRFGCMQLEDVAITQGQGIVWGLQWFPDKPFWPYPTICKHQRLLVALDGCIRIPRHPRKERVFPLFCPGLIQLG